MATYIATISSKHSQEEAFDYLARFSSAREWDPGIVEARDLTGPPVQFGSRFELVSRFVGRRVTLVYHIFSYDRPKRFVVRAEGGTFVSEDTISVEPTEQGCIVRYEATLEFNGPMRFLGPVWQMVFNRIGSRAADGLRDRLNQDVL